jgi:hypothetical protein
MLASLSPRSDAVRQMTASQRVPRAIQVMMESPNACHMALAFAFFGVPMSSAHFVAHCLGAISACVALMSEMTVFDTSKPLVTVGIASLDPVLEFLFQISIGCTIGDHVVFVAAMRPVGLQVHFSRAVWLRAICSGSPCDK